MNGLAYLAVGFGLVWLLVAAYLVWLGRRQTVLSRRLAELEASTPDADNGLKG